MMSFLRKFKLTLENTFLHIVFIYARNNPQWLANFRYRHSFGRNINWERPTEFNEKIRWMQFNTDTSKWSLLADKYRVREYLIGKGYEDILVNLFGQWDAAEDIDFEILPNSFVLKTNHGYGEVIIVKDKSQINQKKVRDKMRYYLSTPYGYETVEPHYLRIKPCIIAEELLPNDSVFSSSIVDYKFYCFSGEPVICGVYYNRDSKTHETQSSFYDMDWHLHPDWQDPRKKTRCVEVPRPKYFDQMRKLCRDLCSEFPFVRLDLYESCDKLYFGEFTFTPGACSGGSLNPILFDVYGKMINLPMDS